MEKIECLVKQSGEVKRNNYDVTFKSIAGNYVKQFPLVHSEQIEEHLLKILGTPISKYYVLFFLLAIRYDEFTWVMKDLETQTLFLLDIQSVRRALEKLDDNQYSFYFPISSELKQAIEKEMRVGEL